VTDSRCGLECGFCHHMTLKPWVLMQVFKLSAHTSGQTQNACDSTAPPPPPHTHTYGLGTVRHIQNPNTAPFGRNIHKKLQNSLWVAIFMYSKPSEC
jgi:hypothetical protein